MLLKADASLAVSKVRKKLRKKSNILINEEYHQMDEECKNHMEEMGYEKMLSEADTSLCSFKRKKSKKEIE